MTKKSLNILGTRGIPAQHGGFETFAENLALYLVGKGWDINVYCQSSACEASSITYSIWNGVNLVHIPVKGEGAKATILFDYLSVKHASRQKGLVLTLGYNTALFNILLRISGVRNLINMDGIEWKRDKWKWYEKAWLYLNERFGCIVANHLIADHPEIKNHLATRVKISKIAMIPYGARSVALSDMSLINTFGLTKKKYCIVIARPEPENSILEIIKAFSEKKRGINLVVLGKYDSDVPYQRSVIEVASEEVLFLGAIYDHDTLDALRHHSCLYIHGHTVGGTNPSLIEALGSAQPVLAHNNKFNRWVAGEKSAYFDDTVSCLQQLDFLLGSPDVLKEMSSESVRRFESMYTWDKVLWEYEILLSDWS